MRSHWFHGVACTLVVLGAGLAFAACGRSGSGEPQATRCSSKAVIGTPIELGLSAEVPGPVVTAVEGQAVVVGSAYGHLVMRTPKPLPAVLADVCLLQSRGATATFVMLRPGEIGFWSSAAHAGAAMDPLMSGTVEVIRR